MSQPLFLLLPEVQKREERQGTGQPLPSRPASAPQWTQVSSAGLGGIQFMLLCTFKAA